MNIVCYTNDADRTPPESVFLSKAWRERQGRKGAHGPDGEILCHEVAVPQVILDSLQCHALASLELQDRLRQQARNIECAEKIR